MTTEIPVMYGSEKVKKSNIITNGIHLIIFKPAYHIFLVLSALNV